MFRRKFLEVNMQRNLFKFGALNSFKIVWAISVVLLTCVIANAQILQTGKDKAVAPCIDSLKVLDFTPDSITVSFTTSKPLSTSLHALSKWRSFIGGENWVRVDGRADGADIVYSPYESIGEERGYTIEVGAMGKPVRRGEKYKLTIAARRSADSRLDETFYCEKEFIVRKLFKPMKSLNNLRLGKPKPNQ